jgi:hypothetical protein
LEFVLLDQLIQVNTQELKGDACVGSKDKVVKHVNDVVGIVLVLLAQVFQDSDFFLGLPVKPFLVSYHFQGNMEVTFVIIGLDHLTEAALSNDFEHFIAVGQVVVGYVGIGTLVVVVAAVVGTANDARPFLGVGPDEVDLRIVEDLMVFVRRQLVHVKFHHLQNREKMGLLGCLAEVFFLCDDECFFYVTV